MKKHLIPLSLSVASSLLVLASTVEAKTFTESMQQGSSVKVNIRSRYEDVTEDVLNTNVDREADAWTTRLRLTYQSGPWNGFSFGAEMDHVEEMENKHDYRTAANDSRFPAATTAVIADPVGTDLNQIFITYANFNNQVRVGRQRLVLDNARFIGNVGWRQNEQTYDGISWTNKTVRYTNFTYAYFKNANRVFGDNNPIGDIHMKTHILNASYTGFDAGKLIGYAYMMDVDDPVSQKGLTGDTIGVRWQGTLGESILYNLEYATQQDAGATESFDANYMLADLTYNVSRYSFTAGYELLGSDDGQYGFYTPLATLHVFQGWADKFLASTPAAGLEDKHIKFGVTFAGAQAQLAYHKFDSDEDSLDYGDEIDFSLSKKFGAVVWTAKLAEYSMGDTNAALTDTSKFWLMMDWNF